MKLLMFIIASMGFLTTAIATSIDFESRVAAAKREFSKATDINIGNGVAINIDVDVGHLLPPIASSVNNPHKVFAELDLKRDNFVPRNATRRQTAEGGVAEGMVCWPVAGNSWSESNTRFVAEGISFLGNLDEECFANSRVCNQIACNGGVAIYLCNDNYFGIMVPCYGLAVYAQDIVNACQHRVVVRPNVECYVSGQQFSSAGYNIVVRSLFNDGQPSC